MKRILKFLSLAVICLFIAAFIFSPKYGSPANETRFPRGVEIVQVSAKNATPDAERLLAYLYMTGLSVKKDPAEALVWYKKAAEHDSQEAMWYLGLIYLAGAGVDQDVEEGKKWLTKANIPPADNVLKFIAAKHESNEKNLAANSWAIKEDFWAGANYGLKMDVQKLLDLNLKDKYPDAIHALRNLEGSAITSNLFN